MDATGSSSCDHGGASGISLATARRLRAAGLDLLLADLKEEALTEAQAALNAEAGAGVVRIQRCDVSKEADVDALREAARPRTRSLPDEQCGRGSPYSQPWADLQAGSGSSRSTSGASFIAATHCFPPCSKAVNRGSSSTRALSRGSPIPRGTGVQPQQSGGEKLYGKPGSRPSSGRELRAYSAPFDPRLHLHGHDCALYSREAGGGLDRRAGRSLSP